MRFSKTIPILIFIVLAGAAAGHAQSLIGRYEGSVTFGDTSETMIPLEFVQSIDLAVRIDLSDEGTYIGSVSFRRPFRRTETGPFADAQAPFVSLVINEDWTFQARSAPIRHLVNGRTVERQVTLTGWFVPSAENPCFPTLQADFFETLRGLVFKPLEFSGPMTLVRVKDNMADDGCLPPVQ